MEKRSDKSIRSYGYAECLVVFTAQHRNVAQAFCFTGSAASLCGSTAATGPSAPGIFARAALRCSVLAALRQKVTMMIALKNQAALDEAVYAYLAKAIVLHCMRNTCLEDLHAGVYPDSATGDYSYCVIKVVVGAELVAI
jgi:hypothetical protein